MGPESRDQPSFIGISISAISDDSIRFATARSAGRTAMVTGSNAATAFATMAHSCRAAGSSRGCQFCGGRNCIKVRSCGAHSAGMKKPSSAGARARSAAPVLL